MGRPKGSKNKKTLEKEKLVGVIPPGYVSGYSIEGSVITNTDPTKPVSKETGLDSVKGE